ncbi:MAG: sigma factor-like helix-turn-helix DNA-binding protein [Flavobacterium sp.]
MLRKEKENNYTLLPMKQLDTRVIDRTNKFYLEMSKKVLTDREYEILHKLLIDKKPIHEVSKLYGLTNERIRQIYLNTCNKVKNATGVLNSIDHYKQILEELKRQWRIASKGELSKSEDKIVQNLDRSLVDFSFPFSKRMNSFFDLLEVKTLRELSAITLQEFSCIRGFKGQLKKELTAFIEFENIESLFEGFHDWKDIQNPL